jgi:hypothetical protein
MVLTALRVSGCRPKRQYSIPVPGTNRKSSNCIGVFLFLLLPGFHHPSLFKVSINWVKIEHMAFDQYHEPPEELSQPVRTFARMILSLIEEAQAIDWYEQRISLEKDKDATKIMQHAQEEEFIHFSMDLEFLLRKKDKWRKIMKNVLFKPGDIVKNAEKAEDAVEG